MSKRLPHPGPDQGGRKSHKNDSYSVLQFKSMLVTLVVANFIPMRHGNRHSSFRSKELVGKRSFYESQAFPNPWGSTSLQIGFGHADHIFDRVALGRLALVAPLDQLEAAMPLQDLRHLPVIDPRRAAMCCGISTYSLSFSSRRSTASIGSRILRTPLKNFFLSRIVCAISAFDGRPRPRNPWASMYSVGK